ncbi:MAG: nuclear transport factor 2 family protein [Actinomycetota bacterium]
MADGAAPRNAIDRYYGAMRVGADAEVEMMSLFADDAVYAEPFSGRDEPAVGKESIRERMQAGWAAPLPNLELDVLSVELTGDAAVCTWECRSSAFPAPVLGRDEYTFADGLITSLVVTITSEPPGELRPG